VRARTIRAIAAVAGCAVFLATGVARDTRFFTDAAGRRVQVPVKASRVMAAGPPASILIYAVAAETLLGWTRPLSEAERAYLPAPYVQLPVVGRLTGRANTANVEAVLAAKADLIIDVGVVNATYASLADRIQEQTGIPFVLLDGRFDATAATIRAAADLTGRSDRGAELAAYAERTLADIRARVATIPDSRRPRVYYGRGPTGLETGLGGSINVEMLTLLGARNVAAEAGAGSLAQVSIEQIFTWDPDVILTTDAAFAALASKSPVWQGLRAAKNGRFHLSPAGPFPWFDVPPSVNRLLGARWAASLLYPGAFPEDLRAITRDFCRRFYHVDLSERQIDALIGPPAKRP